MKRPFIQTCTTDEKHQSNLQLFPNRITPRLSVDSITRTFAHRFFPVFNQFGMNFLPLMIFLALPMHLQTN